MLKFTLLQIDGFGFAGPIGLVIAILFIFILLITLIKRYKRCPSDRILVVYGKVGGEQSAKCSTTVNVDVTPVNDAPVAKDDTAITDEDTPQGA